MTRFPQMRQLMSASAIAVPSLYFSSFLLFASGSVIWSVLGAALAFILGLAFPYSIADRRDLRTDSETPDSSIVRWVGRAACSFVFFWVICQPEFTPFEDRVLHGGALWDWRLVVPLAVLTAYHIHVGLKRVPRISDTAIYSYFTSTAFGGQQAQEQ